MGRRTFIQLYYKGQELDQWINDYLTSFSYEDPAAGESDSLSITLHDMEKKWIGKWMPVKGDYLIAAINNEKCGAFLIDDISFSGRPLQANIKGVSTPANTCFKNTKRSKTWKKISIQEIGTQVASTYGLEYIYDGSAIIIDSLEQSEQSDSEFLENLCKKYGLSMKLYSYKLIIYDDAIYEQKQEVATIDEKEMLSWSYNSTLDGTYTGGKIQYTNPNSEKTIDLVVGDSTRLYESTEKADSLEDAKRIIVSAVNEANKELETISFSLPGLLYKIYASNVVEIKGLESANGKYYVTKVSHSVGSGYVMNVEARKIQPRLTVT